MTVAIERFAIKGPKKCEQRKKEWNRESWAKTPYRSPKGSVHKNNHLKYCGDVDDDEEEVHLLALTLVMNLSTPQLQVRYFHQINSAVTRCFVLLTLIILDRLR